MLRRCGRQNKVKGWWLIDQTLSEPSVFMFFNCVLQFTYIINGMLKFFIAICFSDLLTCWCSYENTQISHAVCDLGLSIAKRLVNDQSDISGMDTSLTLPPFLYKPAEKKEGENIVVSVLHWNYFSVTFDVLIVLWKTLLETYSRWFRFVALFFFQNHVFVVAVHYYAWHS